jgi:hypothetical protein
MGGSAGGIRALNNTSSMRASAHLLFLLQSLIVDQKSAPDHTEWFPLRTFIC